MRKKLLALGVGILCAAAGGVAYLNQVVVPGRVKTFLLGTLASSTGKQAKVDSVRVSLFKGIVVRGLAVYDRDKTYLSVREMDARFQFLPFLKKQIVISSLRVEGASVSLRRRPDGSWDAFTVPGRKGAPSGTPPFIPALRKLILLDSRLEVKDEAVSPAVVAVFSRAQGIIKVSLSGKASFSMQAVSEHAGRARVYALGDYDVKSGSGSLSLSASGIPLESLAAYYPQAGVTSVQGTGNIRAVFSFSEDVLDTDVHLLSGKAVMHALDMEASGPLDARALFSYSFGQRQLQYSGAAELSGIDVKGVPVAGEVSGIRGRITFDGSGARVPKVEGMVWGVPCRASVGWENQGTGHLLQVDATAEADAGQLQQIAKEQFRVTLPEQLQGMCAIGFKYRGDPSVKGSGQWEGELSSGRITFSPAFLPELKEGVQGRVLVRSSGAAPSGTLELNGSGLSLSSEFEERGDAFVVTRAKGTYRQSSAAFNGTVYLKGEMPIDCQGDLAVQLADAPYLIPSWKEWCASSSPQGIVRIKASVQGSLSDLPHSLASAQGTAGRVSLYGLAFDNATFLYAQEGGTGTLSTLNADFYGGSIGISGKADLLSRPAKFTVTAKASRVDLEKLKNDTPARKKDLAGEVEAQMKVSGTSAGTQSLSGTGKVSIKKGRLWELDMFKGMGKLIFSRDFAHVVFRKGQCAFTVKDKAFSTRLLILESDIAELNGPARIGFDGSLAAKLNVSILDEMVPLTNTFKDITTTIAGHAGKVGIIYLGGTVQKPVTSFDLAGIDVLKGIKNFIFSK